MSSPTLPREILEHILRDLFSTTRSSPGPSATPPSLKGTTAILRVSRSIRLLALPYLYHTITITRPSDWSLFFSPSSGIFASSSHPYILNTEPQTSEPDAAYTRWSWVKHIFLAPELALVPAGPFESSIKGELIGALLIPLAFPHYARTPKHLALLTPNQTYADHLPSDHELLETLVDHFLGTPELVRDFAEKNELWELIQQDWEGVEDREELEDEGASWDEGWDEEARLSSFKRVAEEMLVEQVSSSVWADRTMMVTQLIAAIRPKTVALDVEQLRWLCGDGHELSQLFHFGAPKMEVQLRRGPTEFVTVDETFNALRLPNRSAGQTVRLVDFPWETLRQVLFAVVRLSIEGPTESGEEGEENEDGEAKNEVPSLLRWDSEEEGGCWLAEESDRSWITNSTLLRSELPEQIQLNPNWKGWEEEV